MQTSRNITIAGGGIGGLVSGIILQKAGFSVSVFEKLNNCGARFHGDWQGIENWSSDKDIIEELKIFGIDITDIIIPTSNFTAFSYKKTFQINSSYPAFYLVKRGSDKGTLDQKLKYIAEQCGVKIHYDTPVVSMDNIDIVATGPNPKNSIYIAKGLNFTTDCYNVAAVYLDTKRFPYGYAYFLTINGQATLAMCGKKNTLQKKEKMLNDAIDFFRSKLGLFEIQNKRNFGGYGITPLPNIFSISKPLIIGEAAGLQDNLFGFGMRYAFRSAIAASQCIANDVPYHSFFKNKLAPDVVASRLWGKIIFRALKNPGIDFICSMAEKDCQSSLKPFYNSSLFTKIAGPIFS